MAVNAAEEPAQIQLELPEVAFGGLVDLRDGERRVPVRDGRSTLEVPPRWGRILRLE